MDHDLTTAPGAAAAADALRPGGPDTGGTAPGAEAGAAPGARRPPRPRSSRGGIPGQAGGGSAGGGDGGGGAGGGADGTGSPGGAGNAGSAPGADSGASGFGGSRRGAGSAAASRADGGGADRAGAAGPGADAGTTDARATDGESRSGNQSGPSPVSTVRLASPGSVIASIPFLFGFHPENSLVVLGISHSAEGGSFIRHGVRIDLDQVRGQERGTALELAARLRDQDADIAILIAFGPRAATGVKARPDHCRKLMAAFRAQLEAAASEERVTVVDALYSVNGRWWSYMCRNNRCCPSAGTVVPAEAPAALAGAFATRGHTVYASREALDATLDPYPPEILARTAAAAEHLDPAWYDTDAGLADARRLMDALLTRCGPDTEESTPRAPRSDGPRAGRRGLSDNATAALAGHSATDPQPAEGSGAGGPAGKRSARSADACTAGGSAGADSSAGSRSDQSAASDRAADAAASQSGAAVSQSDEATAASGSAAAPSARAATAASQSDDASTADGPAPARSGRSGDVDSVNDSAAARSSRPDADDRPASPTSVSDSSASGHSDHSETSDRSDPRPPHSTGAVIPAARTSRRVSNRVPALGGKSEGVPLGALAEPPGSLLAPPVITDGEAAELLIALLNWRVRDYLACAAATVDSAGRLLRLGAELARRAPHPELRLAPYALAAWAAWAISRPAIAQCAVDRALAIDPEYKFASLIRAGLHHAIDGEGVRESAASTRRDLFGEAAVDTDAGTGTVAGAGSADSDSSDPDPAPTSIPAPRSTETVPTESGTNLEIP